MAKLSIPSAPQTQWPLDLPSGLSLIRSLNDAAIVSSLHANHKIVLRVEDRGRPIGTSNRSQAICLTVVRNWRYPAKTSDRQSNTAPTTFGKRRRDVVERTTTGGGQNSRVPAC